jgi:hypothetical protein
MCRVRYSEGMPGAQTNLRRRQQAEAFGIVDPRRWPVLKDKQQLAAFGGRRQGQQQDQ